MAKRPTTRSKANETSAEPAAPKPKRTRTTAAAEQEPVGPTAAAPVAPTDEDIRRRAYERYQQRGGNHGQHFDDWLEAEKELKTKK
jgi:hypothetical protein